MNYSIESYFDSNSNVIAIERYQPTDSLKWWITIVFTIFFAIAYAIVVVQKAATPNRILHFTDI